MPFDEVVTTSTVFSGVDTFLRLTRRDGWSAAGYRCWLRRMAAETIWKQT